MKSAFRSDREGVRVRVRQIVESETEGVPDLDPASGPRCYQGFAVAVELIEDGVNQALQFSITLARDLGRLRSVWSHASILASSRLRT